jgi:hypothetical protein
VLDEYSMHPRAGFDLCAAKNQKGDWSSAQALCNSEQKANASAKQSAN